MVTRHANGSSPFGGLEANTADRLLEMLAEMDLDPAERLPVEPAIMVASRLGLTQQELSEAHAELRRRMTTDTVPALPGGPKRLATRGARGIPARIDKPQPERRAATLTDALDLPADLYADQPESVRARVYQVLRENRVDLRFPIGTATCQAIAFAAGTQAASLRGILNHIRMALGIIAAKGRGRETRIALPDGVLPSAPATLIDQVEEIIDTRGINLHYLPPDGFVKELMERFDRTEDSIRTVLKTIRKKRNIRGTGRPLPGSKPRVLKPEARARERDPDTGHFLRSDGTNTASEKQNARALALEIAAELRGVEGEKRAQALIQAGRLVEKLLG